MAANVIIKNKKEINRAIREFVTIMGNEAKNHFIKSFTDQGFTDSNLIKWKPRKSKSLRERGRGILIKTGDLRRSIRVINKTFNSVTLGTVNNKYGVYHNEGTGRLPKRQFMGNSRALNNRLRAIFNKKINMIYR
jgi:hypothetical protein